MIFEITAGVVLGLTIFYIIVLLISVGINFVADLRWGKENPTLGKILKEKLPDLNSDLDRKLLDLGKDLDKEEEKTLPTNIKPDILKAMFNDEK